MIYTIRFKAHSNSERVYTLTTDDKGTAFFTAAALREAHWRVLGVEEA